MNKQSLHLLPACVWLVLLLSIAQAQTPAPITPPPPADLHWHSLVLPQATPSEIMKQMNWGDSIAGPMDFTPPPPAPGDAPPPRSAKLPAGVEKIIGDPARHTLVIQATDKGFASVKQIVQALDPAPPQVYIRAFFIAVPAAYGPVDFHQPAKLFAQLKWDHLPVTEAERVITTSGVTSTIEYLGVRPGLTYSGLGPLPRPKPVLSHCVLLTPRINADETVTLSVTQASPTQAALPSATEPQDTTPRTVVSGGMTAYEETSLNPVKGERLILFLEPTILVDQDPIDVMYSEQSTSVPPSPVSPAEKTVSVVQGDIHAVVNLLEHQANIEAVVRDGETPFKAINLNVTDMPLSRVLRLIALCAGAKVTQQPDGVYVIAPGEGVFLNAPVKDAAPFTQSAVYNYHTLALQHIAAGDVMTMMHWNAPISGTNPFQLGPLPVGVKGISALTGKNSLAVEATDEGFAEVQRIIKYLDVVPRRVQMKVKFVAVPEADAPKIMSWLYPGNPEPAHSNEIADFLSRLPNAGTQMPQPILVTTSSNVSLVMKAVDFGLTHGSSFVFSLLKVSNPVLTPRVNSDDTILVALSWQAAVPEPQTSSSLPEQILSTLHTVHNGDMTAYHLIDLPATHEKLFLCVTPTILPTAETFEIPALMETSPPDAKQHWYRLPLQHEDAHDLVQRMRWQDTAWLWYHLPVGVERVFPATFDNALLMHSTEEGFEEIRQFVRILDKPNYTFAPRLTYMTVSAKEAGLSIAEPSVKALNIFNTANNVKAFERLTQSGHAGIETKTNAEAKGMETQMWFLPDVIVDSPRLRSDDTLTLDFTGHNWNGPSITVSGIHRGDVLVAAWKGSPKVTLIQVDF